MIYFTAHTFKCVCHCRRAMFRVLGMYNFVYNINWIKTKSSDFILKMTMILKKMRTAQLWSKSERTQLQVQNNLGPFMHGHAVSYYVCMYWFANMPIYSFSGLLFLDHLKFSYICLVLCTLNRFVWIHIKIYTFKKLEQFPAKNYHTVIQNFISIFQTDFQLKYF